MGFNMGIENGAWCAVNSSWVHTTGWATTTFQVPWWKQTTGHQTTAGQDTSGSHCALTVLAGGLGEPTSQWPASSNAQHLRNHVLMVLFPSPDHNV